MEERIVGIRNYAILSFASKLLLFKILASKFLLPNKFKVKKSQLNWKVGKQQLNLKVQSRNRVGAKNFLADY